MLVAGGVPRRPEGPTARDEHEGGGDPGGPAKDPGAGSRRVLGRAHGGLDPVAETGGGLVVGKRGVGHRSPFPAGARSCSSFFRPRAMRDITVPIGARTIFAISS